MKDALMEWVFNNETARHHHYLLWYQTQSIEYCFFLISFVCYKILALGSHIWVKKREILSKATEMQK